MSKRKRKRRPKALRAQARLAKNPGVSSLLLVNPAPAPKKAPTEKKPSAFFNQQQLNAAVATALKGRKMPQRAKRQVVAKPKRRKQRPHGAARASTARPAAQHASPTVQIINSPEGKTSLHPTTRRKRDGRKMNLDLGKQYRGVQMRKGPWRGKHERRGLKTLEAHRKSILWNLGKGSPAAQQWVLEHIPKMNPAPRFNETARDMAKDVGLGIATFLGARLASNAFGKLPIVSRMGPAGNVLGSAAAAGLSYFLVGKRFPALKRPLLIGGTIGLIDSVIKNWVVPRVPASIAGALGNTDPAPLPAGHSELPALPAHGVGDDSDYTDGSEDADDLHARSISAHRMLGFDAEDHDIAERIDTARAARGVMGDDDADELAELREYVRQQRGMGFDVHRALAGCGCPLGDEGMGFDVHPAVADYNEGMGFDVHPAVADYDGGMGFAVHPAVAGSGYDVMGEDGFGDDGIGAEEPLADSGDGLGMNVHEAQAGVEDMGHYVSTATGAVDNGQGAYVSPASSMGAYVPSGAGAYTPSSAPMGSYVPMGGADAEQIAAMMFGGPWALAELNALRRRRRHRRPRHHGHHGRWYFDPRLRRWQVRPLGDSDDAEEMTPDEYRDYVRRQRGVMGVDDMQPGRYGHGRHAPHPHYRHPMHLECDFSWPSVSHYGHRPYHVRVGRPQHGPQPHHAQNWQPMHAPRVPMPHAPGQPVAPQLVPAPPSKGIVGPSQSPMARAQQAAPAHSEGFTTPDVAKAGGIFSSNG